MTGRTTASSLAVLCALLVFGVWVQSATAAGQTALTCAPTRGGAGVGGDSNCEEETYEQVGFSAPTSATVTDDGNAVLTVAKLHGVSNVEVVCSSATGTATMENSEVGGVMAATGSGTIEWGGCTANHECTVSVAPASVKAETVEGLAEEGRGLTVSAKTGTVITKITFAGATCPLKAFGAVPVSGSAVATAAGEPDGIGARAVFTKAMGSITVGGEAAAFEGTATVKGEDGDQVVVN